MKPFPSIALFRLGFPPPRCRWIPLIARLFTIMLLLLPFSFLQAQQSAPRILSPPSDLTVYAGAPATFTVSATGTSPLQYQWFGPISVFSNTTTATLSLPRVDLSDAGNYYVKVSNNLGSTSSPPARLTVIR